MTKTTLNPPDSQIVHTVTICWGEDTVRINVGGEEHVLLIYIKVLSTIYGEGNVHIAHNTGKTVTDFEETRKGHTIWQQAHQIVLSLVDKDAAFKAEFERSEREEEIKDEWTKFKNKHDRTRLNRLAKAAKKRFL